MSQRGGGSLGSRGGYSSSGSRSGDGRHSGSSMGGRGGRDDRDFDDDDLESLISWPIQFLVNLLPDRVIFLLLILMAIPVLVQDPSCMGELGPPFLFLGSIMLIRKLISKFFNKE